MQRTLWFFAKALEGIGLVLVLVGLALSVQLGLDERGLESMAYEGKGLLLGGASFVAGWLLERAIRTR